MARRNVPPLDHPNAPPSQRGRSGRKGKPLEGPGAGVVLRKRDLDCAHPTSSRRPTDEDGGAAGPGNDGGLGKQWGKVRVPPHHQRSGGPGVLDHKSDPERIGQFLEFTRAGSAAPMVTPSARDDPGSNTRNRHKTSFLPGLLNSTGLQTRLEGRFPGADPLRPLCTASGSRNAPQYPWGSSSPAGGHPEVGGGTSGGFGRAERSTARSPSSRAGPPPPSRGGGAGTSSSEEPDGAGGDFADEQADEDLLGFGGLTVSPITARQGARGDGSFGGGGAWPHTPSRGPAERKGMADKMRDRVHANASPTTAGGGGGGRNGSGNDRKQKGGGRGLRGGKNSPHNTSMADLYRGPPSDFDPSDRPTTATSLCTAFAANSEESEGGGGAHRSTRARKANRSAQRGLPPQQRMELMMNHFDSFHDTSTQPSPWAMQMMDRYNLPPQQRPVSRRMNRRGERSSPSHQATGLGFPTSPTSDAGGGGGSEAVLESIGGTTPTSPHWRGVNGEASQRAFF